MTLYGCSHSWLQSTLLSHVGDKPLDKLGNCFSIQFFFLFFSLLHASNGPCYLRAKATCGDLGISTSTQRALSVSGSKPRPNVSSKICITSISVLDPRSVKQLMASNNGEVFQSGVHKSKIINNYSTRARWILCNYPPKGRWIVVDIHRDAKRRGIHPPLFTDPEGDSCFSICQIRWIKKRFFSFFF